LALLLAWMPAANADGPSGEECFSGTENPDVTSRVTWTTTSAGTTIRVTFSKNFVDNTYGVNSINWPGKGHQFKQLVGSDHVILSLYDGSGEKKMEVKIDYISEDQSAASGYKTKGVSGGDGDMLMGDESDVLAVETSLSKNFNTYGYVLTQDSPATNENYDPNPQYPNWIFEVWYEVTVDPAAFGSSGFDHADMTHVHASPSKTGNNSEEVQPSPCPPPSPSPTPTESPCPEGQMRDSSGNCGPSPSPTPAPCPSGEMRDEHGECGPSPSPSPTPCPSGQMRDENGHCKTPPASSAPPCPQGQMRDEQGHCKSPPATSAPPCPEGQMRDENGTCGPSPCPEGEMRDENGTCAPSPCPDGQMRDESGQCAATPKTAPIPFFPTAASLGLAAAGVLVAGFVMLRRRA